MLKVFGISEQDAHGSSWEEIKPDFINVTNYIQIEKMDTYTIFQINVAVIGNM